MSYKTSKVALISLLGVALFVLGAGCVQTKKVADSYGTAPNKAQNVEKSKLSIDTSDTSSEFKQKDAEQPPSPPKKMRGTGSELVGKTMDQIRAMYGSPTIRCQIVWINREFWVINVGRGESTGLRVFFNNGKVYRAYFDEFSGFDSCDDLYDDWLQTL